MSRDVITFKDAKGKTQRFGYTLKNPATRPPKRAQSVAFVPVGELQVFQRLENIPASGNRWLLNVDGVSYELDGPVLLGAPRFPRLHRLWRNVRKAFRRA